MKSKKALWIFIVCYIAYTAIYVARLNLSMASPGLREMEIMNATQIGLLGSVFSVVYAFGRFINGALSDKTPPWIMIGAGLLVAGLSNIAIGFFPPFIGMFLLWGANAYAQSMLWSSVLCTMSDIYDEQTAKKKTSYMVTSVAVGNILGIILNTFIIEHIGIGFAFIIPGGITLVMSTVVVLTMRKVKAAETSEKKHISIWGLFKNEEIRLAIFPAFLHGVMKDNISLWMAVYFVDKFSISLSESAYFVLLIPCLGLIGRMIYPALYKISGEKEHRVSVYSFIVCVIMAAILCFDVVVNPVTAMLCLSFIYMAVSVINTSMLSIFPMRFINTGNVASVSGVMDFATYGGAGVSSVIYGIVIEQAGYLPMFISWAAVSVLSIIILKVLINKTKKLAV